MVPVHHKSRTAFVNTGERNFFPVIISSLSFLREATQANWGKKFAKNKFRFHFLSEGVDKYEVLRIDLLLNAE